MTKEMPPLGKRDLATQRQQTLNHLLDLIKYNPGIEQRHLPGLLGCGSQKAKEFVDQLCADGKVQRQKNSSGSVTLYTPEYLLRLEQRMQAAAEKPYKPQWNSCRNYSVPKSMVLQFRDTSIPVPEEHRVDLEEPAQAG